jgi:hypothetical protein
MSIRRRRFTRPTLQDFEDRIRDLSEAEAASPRVQWLVAECRRAREEAHSLRNQMRAFRGGKNL